MPRTDSLEAHPGNSSGCSRYSWVRSHKNWHWSHLILGNLRNCIIKGLMVLISLMMKVQLHLQNSLSIECQTQNLPSASSREVHQMSSQSEGGICQILSFDQNCILLWSKRTRVVTDQMIQMTISKPH